MRSTKQAITAALRTDPAVSELVPVAHVYAVERATLPTLPAVEVVGVSSEPQASGPLVKHSMSVEVTVSHPTEDGADERLDSIVAAIRVRLQAAEVGSVPVVFPGGAVAVCELGATRWSVSAGGPSSVIRGAAIALAVGVDE